MNYMSEVAKMLGVELGEEFEIIMPNASCYANAMFTDVGVIITDHNVFDGVTWKPYVLGHLLNGKYTIKRKPWKPSLDEEYYYVDETGYACSDPWVDSALDFVFYKIGNCYKTKEDAEKDKDKWIKFYESDKVLEV